MARRLDIFSIVCFFICISILVGVIFFVFVIVFDHKVAEFHAVDASLTQFNLTDATNKRRILAYNLTVEVKLRNPSKTIGIRYRRIRAAATYKSKKFALITLPPFYQGHKNTTILHPLLFQGEALVKFKKSELKAFDLDQRLGRFGITIEFYLDLTLKLGGLKLRQDPTMLCDLKLPLASYNGSTTAVSRFKTERCYRQRGNDFAPRSY